MIIKELKLLSDGLWESIKNDLKFFASIQSFVRKLSEYDYSNLHRENIPELVIFANKIKDLFDSYYQNDFIVLNVISTNRDSAIMIYQLIHKLQNLTDEELKIEIESITIKTQKTSTGKGYIFIGHGRSKLWARLQVFLQDELNLKTLSFESESHTGESIINILEGFLNKSSYAILVMTAEDITETGTIRARQNVIHEAGLFQGRLGFDKVILLKQDNTEEFSNVAGLQYIPFSGENIEQTFYELGRSLKKNGLIK